MSVNIKGKLMRCYVQTRSRGCDYTFLGASPIERWWRQFDPFTSFEKPTLLLTTNKNGWKVYFSGIPAGRVDRVNTPIRFSVIIEGQFNDFISSAAARMACAWVADTAFGASPGSVQAAFSEAFPESDVENHLERGIKLTDDDIEERIFSAIKVIKKHDCAHVEDQEGAWIGGIDNDDCRDAFFRRVKWLMQGNSGAALMVNLVKNEKEAKMIFAVEAHSAVILATPHNLDDSGIKLADFNARSSASKKSGSSFESKNHRNFDKLKKLFNSVMSNNFDYILLVFPIITLIYLFLLRRNLRTSDQNSYEYFIDAMKDSWYHCCNWSKYLRG